MKLDLIRSIGSLQRSRILLILCLVQVLIHAPFLNQPASGHHVWRQCNSLALARNYAEESMNLFLPRIDKRYNTPGITGPAFPAYEYTLACIYKGVGYSEQAHRYLSLGLSLLALVALFYILLHYGLDTAFAVLGTAAFMGIPEFYYHSINAVPDLGALTAMLWGWRFGLKYQAAPKFLYFLVTTLFLGLAGAMKLQFLLCLFPLAARQFQRNGFRLNRSNTSFVLLGLLACIPGLVWQWYAKQLTAMYGLWEFLSEVRPPQSWATFFKVFASNLLSDVPETWVGYTLLLPAFWGVYQILRRKPVVTAFSMFGALAYYVMLQQQFVHHGYYTIVFLPFVAICIAVGLQYANYKLQNIFAVLVLLAPVWAIARVSHNWSRGADGRIPTAFYKQEFRDRALKNATNASYIVGPDPSGCVYFYYLHAKGYPWYKETDNAEEWNRWIRQGADGFITNHPDLLNGMVSDSIQLQVEDSSHGFYWIRAKYKP